MHWLRSRMQKMLRLLAQQVYQHHKTVFFIASIFTIWGIYLTAFKLGVVNDTNALIRQDSPALKNFLSYVKEFDAADPIVVMIQSPDFEKNRQAADILAQKISQRPLEIKKVYYRNDLTKLKPHFLLYEEEKNLKDIVQQLRSQKEFFGGKSVNLNSLLGEAVNQFERVEKNRGKRGTLEDLGAFADRMIINLEKLAHELNTEKNGGFKVAVSRTTMDELDRQLLLNTYLSFEDGKIVLMMLTPGGGDKTSFSPQGKTIRNLRKDIAETKKQISGIEIGLTGEPTLLDDELNQSTRDMTLSFIIAFLCISLLFIGAYREVVRPLLAITCLTFALFWSLGFTVIVIGHLNIISQAFVLMLLGLGIDFGIQIMGRYEEERSKGRSVLEAIENATQFTGLAVLTGGGITAVAFFTMCFNDFVGLAELGAIAGFGVLFCIAANLILLPALLAWYDSKKSRPLPKHHQSQMAFGKKMDDMLLSRPKAILMMMGIVTLAAGLLSYHVKFDHNLLNLQNPKMESVRLAKRLLESPTNSFLFGVIVADNMDDARAKTERLEKMSSVRSVNSPTKILPENQNVKLEILKDIRKELNKLKFNPDVSTKVNVAQAKIVLKKLLDDSRKGLEEARKFRNAKDPRAMQAFKIFDRLIPALEKSVTNLNKLPQDEAEKRLNVFQSDLFTQMQREFDFLKSFDMETTVTMEDLPPEALQHYISPRGKVLLEVNPKENVWEREPNERFVSDLRSIESQATGTPVQNYVYIEILKKAYVEAACWALGAIVLVVLLYFRNFKKLILTLIPLTVAIIWTLGFMSLFNIPFNPANIITLPLAIGIGVAYGIYIVDRHIEEGRVKLFNSSTGKAVLLSALTTIFGFAAMMLGNHQGMFSLGLVMTIAITFCFLTSILVLPQMLKILDQIKHRAEKKPTKKPAALPATHS